MSKTGSGFILLDKPEGITSFQALYKIKAAYRGKKVGHAGTLDKFASGLLLVLTGNMTRLNPFLTGLDKEYDAVFTFGRETDTLDPEGRIIKEAPIPVISEIEQSLSFFNGRISQQPPDYSAVHVNGERAYKITRKGKKPDIPERIIEIFGFDIIAWDSPDLHVRIACSKGTYIRSLARDLGKSAGSCAFVSSLRRTKIGTYSVFDAVLADSDSVNFPLITGKACFEGLPGIGRIRVTQGQRHHILHGKPVTPEMLIAPPSHAGVYALFDENDTFLAMIDCKDNGSCRYCFVSGENT